MRAALAQFAQKSENGAKMTHPGRHLLAASRQK
ncbi:hypothetical protein METH_12595 [Leisingera methylohalidivorans DSM 14336]|uniref:Uncharacterized protein n=1 Tax=Leisingera methylohalidivorans DSM 14336 TaxID=999552 RepID=V9VWH8_9RHOB|nr:hypothetical protein METH_12595 [Leisingera methylohalidivorans DSM 14336]